MINRIFVAVFIAFLSISAFANKGFFQVNDNFFYSTIGQNNKIKPISKRSLNAEDYKLIKERKGQDSIKCIKRSQFKFISSELIEFCKVVEGNKIAEETRKLDQKKNCQAQPIEYSEETKSLTNEIESLANKTKKGKDNTSLVIQIAKQLILISSSEATSPEDLQGQLSNILNNVKENGTYNSLLLPMIINIDQGLKNGDYTQYEALIPYVNALNPEIAKLISHRVSPGGSIPRMNKNIFSSKKKFTDNEVFEIPQLKKC